MSSKRPDAISEQEEINQQSTNYLLETDWYVIRQLETGIEIPEEVRIKREQARLKHVKIEIN